MTETQTPDPVVEIRNLKVDLPRSTNDVVDEVSLRIWPGEVLGLVGESGCGKTTVGMALLGHCRGGAKLVGGQILIGGRDIMQFDEPRLEAMRGRIVAYIPQDPPTALNPVLRIGTQLREMLDTHARDWPRERRDARLRTVLEEVLLPSDEAFLRRYPHELSGGQQQRVAIAMAFACEPKVIVCDEPTTGLDVTTQARVLETVRDLCRIHGVAALYVSHDLAVVASVAERVAVMYAGRVVETGTRDQLFNSPRHPYTRRLLLAAPDDAGRHVPIGIPGYAPAPGSRPTGCFFAPRCPLAIELCHAEFPEARELETSHFVRCHRAEENVPVAVAASAGGAAAPGDSVIEVSKVSAAYAESVVLHDVSLSIRAHECVALVGESGSGKTTLARCIAGIHSERTGEISFAGQPLATDSRARSAEQRRRIQYVFQNPYASLNPRQTVAGAITTPLRLFYGLKGGAAHRRVTDLLERVALPASLADAFPDQLSGGERQRVAIARSLAADPAVLICDEVTSALDVSVQAAIVDLLAELQRDMGLSILFITHNLPLIRTIADRVAVMSEGHIVDYDATETVFERPSAIYTRELLSHTPTVPWHAAPSMAITEEA